MPSSNRDYWKDESSGDLVDRVKAYAKDHVWALGLGVLNGALSGGSTNNYQEFISSVFLWAGIAPIFSAVQGGDYKQALKRSPENIICYLASYNLTQLVLYTRI